jgi:hypothetical protein
MAEKTPPPEDESDLISESQAAALIGKHVVVGLTFVDADQKPIRLTQLHGYVVKVNRREGIMLKQADGSEYELPPTLEGFQKVPKGSSCTLRSTGELVGDVDYLVSYTVNQYH